MKISVYGLMSCIGSITKLEMTREKPMKEANDTIQVSFEENKLH